MLSIYNISTALVAQGVPRKGVRRRGERLLGQFIGVRYGVLPLRLLLFLNDDGGKAGDTSGVGGDGVLARRRTAEQV